MRKGSVAVLWVVVILLYSLCSGFWKSPEWLPSCGKGPRAGRSVGQISRSGWYYAKARPEKGWGEHGETPHLHPGTQW